MQHSLTARVSAWAWFGFFVAFSTVLLADANRFLPPGRELFAERLGAGGADLLPSYNAAYAYLHGQNPYHDQPEGLPNSLAYEGFLYQYPPTHFLIYVPLVWYADQDFMAAARVQFYASLLAFGLLAWATLELTALTVLMSHEMRYALWPAVTFILALNPGSQLGLERGQSDVFTAACCYWAATSFLRGYFGRAAFLAVASVLLKGYGAPFALGLLLLGMTRRRFKRTFLGATLALGLLLAPVVRFLPEALAALPTRTKMFWSSWNNQSFEHLGFVLQNEWAPTFRTYAIAAAGIATALAWLRLRACVREAPQSGRTALALALYTCASLIFILSFSRNSLAYDAVLVLPAALSLILSQGLLTRGLATQTAVGLSLALAAFALCAFDLDRLFALSVLSVKLPLHTLGQAVLLVLIASARLRYPRYSR